MITEHGIQKLKKYCREPIENIKGYKEAVESEDGGYHCHHINELTFTREELKKMNMLYQRPASELIIMSNSEHRSWHNRWNGKPISDSHKKAISEYQRGRHKSDSHKNAISESLRGDKNPNWKGDDVGPIGAYKRAKKLYQSGEITEEEFQHYRDKLRAYRRSHRLKDMR